MADQLAASKFYQLMIKKGITPEYETIDNKCQIRGHINKFVVRVKSPIVRNGRIYTAEGSGLSKKEAKHEAALAFMRKYDVEDKTDNPTAVAQTVEAPVNCVVNVADNHINSTLQKLCIEWNLGRPGYEVEGATGPPHSRRFTIRCRVTDLSTKGTGSTKAEAKLAATTNMIKVLMQEAEVYRIFESPKSTTTANDNEIICLSENSSGPQLAVATSVSGKRSSSSSSASSDVPPTVLSGVQLPRASRSKQSVALRLLNTQKISENITESSDDSNVSLIDLNDDCLGFERLLFKSRSKSLDNASDLSKLKKSSSHVKAIDKINARLQSVEEQLYNEILSTLQNRDAPRQKTVAILSHEFLVSINDGNRPKIFEGDQECTDSSIRIAALSKLLMDLKDFAETNCKNDPLKHFDV